MTGAPRSPVAEVLAQVLDGLARLGTVTVPLHAAAGCVLAGPATTSTPLPPEDRAAMDGVAVRAADLAGATADRPCRLALDGASLAGRGDTRDLRPGTAREIATGAPLPAGADAIVRVEDLQHADGMVEVAAPVAVGHDVRPAGQDAPAGHVLAPPGRRLDTGALGGLAGAGVTQVEVVPAPRVAVLPTGDEVVAGTTPDAVGPMLRHLLVADGAVVDVAPPAPDRVEVLRTRVDELAVTHDVVVTVGGASVGPRDHADDVVAGLARGASVSLAMRPGRPFAWGRTAAGVTVLCLPGTPIAALAAAVLLVRPVVAHLAGRSAPRPARLPLGAAVEGDPRRRSLVPAAVVDGHARPVDGHGAADLARLAAASALVDLPAGTGRCATGQVVDVWVLP